MIMKKHMVHNFSFYIHKKNIQNTHKMKKKLNIKLIFFYQEKGESYLFILKEDGWDLRTREWIYI